MLLCGRSGCGKTTLTRLINGLIPQFFAGDLSGEVLLDRKNIFDMPMQLIAEKVGSVFQNPRTQFFNVDSDGEIAFGLENKAVPSETMKKRVADTAKDLNIQNLLGRSIFSLSGGEKQKIAFASVYAADPDIYVLDEPSSNLDAASCFDLNEHLKFVKSKGKTIVIAEHRLYYLTDTVDRIIYLNNGCIECDWTASQFKKLSLEQRRNMGLRTTNLNEEAPVCVCENRKENAFEIKNAALSYRSRIVLQNINLSAAKGEVIAVVGPNGAGKTTFSRAICGLHKESEGSYFFKGKQLGAKQRMKISYMVMQDVNYQLFAESVADECTFGLKHPDKALAEATLANLGIEQLASRHPNTLSGGQKQRLAAAVSVVCGKDILVFDEPTSGLDYDSMVRLSAVIRSLSAMGKIIFIVTHDYEFTCCTCSRAIGIADGSIQYDLPIEDAFIKKLFYVR